ncbi:Putative NADH-ubiquinone oxidoreductase-like protein [[Torrubiella] hemipterigena]|uniref:Putative NADH-ubiquinone oxidoreductase-like protein n=1 Tax=[Torrubiella] hemipterigena TaxID=1531966 RepID=A0A0A1TMR3_9HYPO|nr:Putative NADH-ubiquinone oxidoreductase-like protein [[Torrubiella] hemipterigena]
MSSQAVAKAAGGVVSIAKKHTVQSTGVWEALRRVFALDPERSNGVPLNPTFRLPAPGANDPLEYDDPVTLPAGDIAGNPYWKRDTRRAYPRLSVVNQADVVSLLTVGSEAQPKVELIGEAGEKQLVAAKQDGQTNGLSKFLAKSSAGVATKDVFIGGLPPTPSGQSLSSGKWDVHKYKLVNEASYPEEYPARSFQ